MSKMIHINGSQAICFEFLLQEKIQSNRAEMNQQTVGVFFKDAIYTVPQMLVLIFGGGRVIMSHQSYWREEKSYYEMKQLILQVHLEYSTKKAQCTIPVHFILSVHSPGNS